MRAQEHCQGEADESASRDLWVLQVLGLPLPPDADEPDWDAREWDTLWSPMGLGRPLQASLWDTIEEVLRAERPDLVDSWAMTIGRFIWGLTGNVFDSSTAVREALAAGMNGPPPRAHAAQP